MAQYSEEEYYKFLDHMVHASRHHLRKKFADRWRTETGEDWLDDIEHVQRFLNRPAGKKALKVAQAFQKKVLRTKCIDQWDIPLLCLVLAHFGEEGKYKEENGAIGNLRNLRNDLAHHKTKKVPVEEYSQKVAIFKDIMSSLGMKDESIKQLVDEMAIKSSLIAKERVTTLHKEAAEFMQERQFEKAIECFTKAIDMPSLLPIDHGIAYEKRANCLLSTVTNILSDDKKLEQALQDAMLALKFNDHSWEAHYLTAKCYQSKNDLVKATHHYQRAIAISPTQEQLKRDFDSCKLISAQQTWKIHLFDPNRNFVLEKQLIKMELHRLSPGLTKKDYKFNHELCLVRGHQYYWGQGRPQDYVKAVEWYAKAASLKNPEGMCLLAHCYLLGLGVEHNFSEAWRILREVAGMDPKEARGIPFMKYNQAVARAEYTIGYLYSVGVGVEQDYTEAAKWFCKSLKHGRGDAAYNLGVFYLKGNGVPKNEKKAEHFLKQAVNLKCPHAAAPLMDYYLKHNEPFKAEEMRQIAIEMESANLKKDDAVWERSFALQKKQRAEIEATLVEFETTYSLSTKGLTFAERWNRMQALSVRTHNPGPQTKTEKMHLDLAAIEAKAAKASSTDSDTLDGFQVYADLHSLLAKNETLTTWDEQKILNYLYWYNIHYYPFSEDKTRVKSIVSKLFEYNCEFPGEDDMKSRLCFVVSNLSDTKFSKEDIIGVELLKEGIRRYPENESYYVYLSNILISKQRCEEARTVAEQGLLKFPNHVELLLHCALSILSAPAFTTQYEESVTSIKKFLSVAPIDHQHYAGMCYQLSSLYYHGKVNTTSCRASPLQFESVSKKSEERDLSNAKFYFEQGKIAEKELPSLYGEECKAKLEMERIFNNVQDQITEETAGVRHFNKKSVLERKPHLSSLTRRTVTLKHRESLEKDARMAGNITGYEFPCKLRQTMVKNLSLVKPILLGAMNPTEDHVFENRLLDFTIIDEPGYNLTMSPIRLLAEDDYGDVTRLCIYNVDKTPENLSNFQPGCKIGILNPYMRVGAADNCPAIRNDEPRCIVYLEKVENMCRFCGDENVRHKCSKCKRPYCSRECQTLDWKMFKHKLICNLKF